MEGIKTKLWEEFSETNPKYTKSFGGKGGFNGTAINPTYCYKEMTRVFGPAGKGWGYDILSEDFVEGHQLNNTAKCIVHKVLVSVWYKYDGEKYTIPPQFGQTTFVGANKNGIFTDEEAPKKSVTDGVTKCLSLIGFAADIYMGQYDDVKYVSNLWKEFAEENGTDVPDSIPTQAPTSKTQNSNPDQAVEVQELWQKASKGQGKFKSKVMNGVVETVGENLKKYGSKVKISPKQLEVLKEAAQVAEQLESTPVKEEMPDYLND